MKKIVVVVMTVILVFMLSGCTDQSDTYLYKSKDKDWSIRIPKEFKQVKEETDEQYNIHSVTFNSQSTAVLVINEYTDEELEINEDTLKEELEQDDYFKVERYENIDLGDTGKFYGALVTDEATNMAMMYYRIKYNDKAISFIAYRKLGFPQAEEESIRAMLSTFKGIK